MNKLIQVCNCSLFSAENNWSGEMASLFCEMNQERKELMRQLSKEFPDETITGYEQRYDAIILSGREEKNIP